MKPLTIEQWKTLEVGDWVWITDINGCRGRYKQLEEYIDPLTMQSSVRLGKLRTAWENYGKTWLAWKNKEQAESKGEIVELPCKVGDTVWVVDYGEKVCSYVCIGGNSKFLFLSPTFYSGKDIITPDEICKHYVYYHMADDEETAVVVFPHSKCFSTQAEAEAKLAELKGGLYKSDDK